MLDFGTWTRDISRGSTYCDEYATIRETSTGSETRICGGNQRTQNNIYVPNTNSVDVVFNSSPRIGEGKRFLLMYEGKNTISVQLYIFSANMFLSFISKK